MAASAGSAVPIPRVASSPGTLPNSTSAVSSPSSTGDAHAPGPAPVFAAALAAAASEEATIAPLASTSTLSGDAPAPPAAKSSAKRVTWNSVVAEDSSGVAGLDPMQALLDRDPFYSNVPVLDGPRPPIRRLTDDQKLERGLVYIADWELLPPSTEESDEESDTEEQTSASYLEQRDTLSDAFAFEAVSSNGIIEPRAPSQLCPPTCLCRKCKGSSSQTCSSQSRGCSHA